MCTMKSTAITRLPTRWIRIDTFSHLWQSRGLWLGPFAWLLALFGTLWLWDSGARLFSDVMIGVAGVLAVAAWGGQRPRATPVAIMQRTSILWLYRQNSWRVDAVILSVFAALAADIRFIRNPGETFGIAGGLWLLGMIVLPAATMPWPLYQRASNRSPANGRRFPDAWTGVRVTEAIIVVSLITLALTLRIWNLTDVPFAIHPDEIITGRVALQAYAGPEKASVFSTVWSEINLPALWFTSIAASLAIFGHTLAALRLPVALVGAATVIPFYGTVRHAWGRIAATGGALILAVSAVDVHFSRVTVNNLVPTFFWAACFFFLLRGVSERRPIDWSLAGMAAGLSEYTYYGTRLLSLVLLGFCLYLVVIHKRRDLRSMAHFGLLWAGYLVAFGPLLAYYVRNPHMYFGRGQDGLIWRHGPHSLSDLFRMASSLWPPVSQNLLSISTYTDQGSFYWAPLLMPAEAALLVLGFAVLLWRWRRPAEFLMLLSGLGTLFVGGTMVLGAPSLQHWTPAFPAIYAAIAVPIGAWGRCVVASLSRPRRIGCLVLLGLGLSALAAVNINYYFHDYRATRPEFELRAAQSRWEAGLGVQYRVFTVGRTWQPYDAETNGYLIQGQEGGTILHPTTELPVHKEHGKGLGFVFMDDEKQYLKLVRGLYPQGRLGEVRSQNGVHLFFTYVVPPGYQDAPARAKHHARTTA
jgi:4-amino-4-deoxy-L-arabinose transferase-like glycosyltransferase